MTAKMPGESCKALRGGEIQTGSIYWGAFGERQVGIITAKWSSANQAGDFVFGEIVYHEETIILCTMDKVSAPLPHKLLYISRIIGPNSYIQLKSHFS